MINSYDKIKTKFNLYAAKCLSEKQKRECGIALVAPALVLPHERNKTPNMMFGGLGELSPKSKRLYTLQKKQFAEEEK